MTRDESAEQDQRCSDDIVDSLQQEDMQERLQRLEGVGGGTANTSRSFGHVV